MHTLAYLWSMRANWRWLEMVCVVVFTILDVAFLIMLTRL